MNNVDQRSVQIADELMQKDHLSESQKIERAFVYGVSESHRFINTDDLKQSLKGLEELVREAAIIQGRITGDKWATHDYFDGIEIRRGEITANFSGSGSGGWEDSIEVPIEDLTLMSVELEAKYQKIQDEKLRLREEKAQEAAKRNEEIERAQLAKLLEKYGND